MSPCFIEAPLLAAGAHAAQNGSMLNRGVNCLQCCWDLLAKPSMLRFEASDPLFDRSMPICILRKRIYEHIRKGFEITRAEQLDPKFIYRATKVVDDFLCTHAVLVLGQTGCGKSTLINSLTAHQDDDRLETGLYPHNATCAATARQLSLEGLKDVRVLLVDTEGWNYRKSAQIRKQYEGILSDLDLACEHTPHIILFCVQVTSFKSFKDDELKCMQRDFRSFKRKKMFPMSVIPVATFADTIPTQEISQAKAYVRQLAQRAFEGTGAEVGDVLHTSCKPGSKWTGVEHVREKMRLTLQKQLHSDEFQSLWRTALARELATASACLFEDFPGAESEWWLFNAARDTIAAACDKVPKAVETVEPRYIGERAPWWSIPEIPHSEKMRFRPRAFFVREGWRVLKCVGTKRSLLLLTLATIF
eukprot:TRINITY_DN104777_c0_g1_i2.p1 TRINITY_DN104777_c0_g1~~TRINITY_DN104777_c0_g1_i2.p1  ORF type:complete len:432 (-),score=51.32 TRINITY_DN104777_c0_g1_i2:502-1755(-)